MNEHNHNHVRNEDAHNEHAYLEHVHTENCTCGLHHHNHDRHAHDENGNCIIDGSQAPVIMPGKVNTEAHIHDEARVISGSLTLTSDYDKVKKTLADHLEKLAKTVQERGGIVGHIKASCTVSTVEMFSVTESSATVKRAPDQEIRISLAAIVFLIDPHEAQELAQAALEAVRAVSRL